MILYGPSRGSAMMRRSWSTSNPSENLYSETSAIASMSRGGTYIIAARVLLDVGHYLSQLCMFGDYGESGLYV